MDSGQIIELRIEDMLDDGRAFGVFIGNPAADSKTFKASMSAWGALNWVEAPRVYAFSSGIFRMPISRIVRQITSVAYHQNGMTFRSALSDTCRISFSGFLDDSPGVT